MVDANNEAGRQSLRRAEQAARTENLGPGTSGQSTSGAAYRGQDVADARGVAGPAEPGFGGERTGLGYTADAPPAASGYAKAETVPGAADRYKGTFAVTAGMAGPSDETGPEEFPKP